MKVCFSTDAIVDAEQVGNGRLSWMWVFICAENAMLLAQSEPIFRTRQAALRVGHNIQAYQRIRLGRLQINKASTEINREVGAL